jgi:hypothetical protein
LSAWVRAAGTVDNATVLLLIRRPTPRALPEGSQASERGLFRGFTASPLAVSATSAIRLFRQQTTGATPAKKERRSRSKGKTV